MRRECCPNECDLSSGHSDYRTLSHELSNMTFQLPFDPEHEQVQFRDT